jgi:hypothetical protein
MPRQWWSYEFGADYPAQTKYLIARLPSPDRPPDLELNLTSMNMDHAAGVLTIRYTGLSPACGGMLDSLWRTSKLPYLYILWVDQFWEEMQGLEFHDLWAAEVRTSMSMPDAAAVETTVSFGYALTREEINATFDRAKARLSMGRL